MHQFHKLSKLHLDEAHIKEKNKSSDSDQLQRLWDKIQDLSEVQDQSRNQQMPVFLDDNSVLSKHNDNSFMNQNSNDSFYQTVQILDNHNNDLNKVKHCYEVHKTKLDKEKHFYSMQLPQNYHQRHNLNDEAIFSYNYDQNSNNLRKDEMNHCNKKNFTCNQLQSRQDKQSNDVWHSDSGIKNRQQDGNQQVNGIASNLKTNEKLLSDNKKLFEECIKLRKQLLQYQLKTQQNPKPTFNQTPSKPQQGLIMQYHQQKIFTFQKQPIFSHKNPQIQNLIKTTQKYSNSQSSSTKEIPIHQSKSITTQQHLQTTNNQTILNTQTNIILQLQTIIKEKQNLLLNLNQAYLESQLQLNQLKAQINYEKQVTSQLQHKHKLKEINTHQSQEQHQITTISLQPTKTRNNLSIYRQTLAYNFQPKMNQKQSRTNSIKSTCISSCNSNLQIALKDKQRQITNMKIVHESQIKKCKSTIHNLQLQLQSITNTNITHTNKQSWHSGEYHPTSKP